MGQARAGGLTPSHTNRECCLQEVRVDAVERVISNANDIMDALVTGEKKRAVSSTAMNERPN